MLKLTVYVEVENEEYILSDTRYYIKDIIHQLERKRDDNGFETDVLTVEVVKVDTIP